MSSRAQTTGIAAVTTLCLGVLAWVLFSSGGNGAPRAGRSEPTQPVLCANPGCGFTGRLTAAQLEAPKDARDIAREPANGPGYVCPKCGQSSLYPDLLKCPTCGTVYMPVPDAAGAGRGKCPKCESESRRPD